MKTKVIYDNKLSSFERELNEFIQDKKIIDIKFASDDGCLLALVLYEDQMEKEHDHES